ncbi:type I pullulanase [Fusibacter ferrireducens]|uniref:Type I pullulanase n=1 Tax=Fusibacter ferrireducens TaxID=2785058 RepID=A0ABR9ZW17_9FIRM|nr:type I pullulanase [Fusibacter ferrireducens]MBF4694634.1 type I pullulanase [Fusibacter ferrireducens]
MEYPVTGRKLGYNYTPVETEFNVWAPTHDDVQLALYEHPNALDRTLHAMTKSEDGVHTVKILGDLHGFFYTYIVNHEIEVTDPYGVSASANSLRTAVLDLRQTDPEGFADHVIPKGNLNCDAILYELHIKDFTGDQSSGVKHKGKFLGLTEKGSQLEGYATGLDHIADLGVTHVHLMPINDYLSVDELSDAPESYNWGYDPEHFNLPEGSYSLSPNDPVSRVMELKMLIQSLHERGLKVILDVVYNHTFRGPQSNFNALVPNYYYRVTQEGIFSNGSGCGNEFASEKPMGRKFIIDSLCYWAREYKVDGFRFDLMALIDIDTINLSIQELKKINPEMMIYGEPWTGGLSLLPESNRIYKGIQCNQCFSLFNDDFRNAIKGDNDGTGHGFVQGNKDAEYNVKVGILGSIPYDQTYMGFAMNPCETINYFNAHDNLIIFDKLSKSMPNSSYEDWIKMNKLCFNIIMTSQGIPFFHAGNEFLRSKKGNHNSYNAPLSINAINWHDKKTHYAFYLYVKDLIELRKTHDCFRITDTALIKKNIHFVDIESSGSNTIVYSIHVDDKEDYDCLLIVHNAHYEIFKLSIADVLRSLCCDLELEITYKTTEIEIKQIFNESGLLHDPVEIPDIAKHIVGINPYSSAIYTFKRLK